MIKNRILKNTDYLSGKKLLRSNNIESSKALTFTKLTKNVRNTKFLSVKVSALKVLESIANMIV